MPNDSHPTDAQRTAALKKKQFYAKLVTFAFIIAVAVLKPKVEAWLDAQKVAAPESADVSGNDQQSEGDVFGSENSQLGTLTINDRDEAPRTTRQESAKPSTSPEPSDLGPSRPPKSTVAEADSTRDSGGDSARDKKTTPLPRMAEPPLGKSPQATAHDDRSNPNKPVASTGSQPASAKASRVGQLGKLTLVRGTRDEFRSFAGLMYVRGSEDGHRLKHVLKHAEDNLDKPIHGVFDGSRDEILAWIDRAYLRGREGGKGTRVEDQGGRTVFTVDLGEKIGHVGGQVGQRKGHPACRCLRLVIQNGSDVVTAYPAQSL